MTLDQYLRENDISESAFAGLVHVSQAQVNRLRKGGWPSKPLMIRIQNATNHQVTANDFLPPPTKRRA